MTRWAYLAAALVVLVAALALGLTRSGSPPSRMTGSQSLPALSTGEQTLRERFAVLTSRHTNQCSLTPQSVDSLAVHGRLQGSCCRPMEFEHYMKQVRGLAAYRGLAPIPRDPYDIPLSQAKQLIDYDRTITLTVQQQAAYQTARKLAHEHGPCCCHCWRWTAFEGQAKYLLTQRRYTPSQIAAVWDLEDGCGGPA